MFKIHFLQLILLAIKLLVSEATKDPNTIESRSVIVHLFEWKWKDVASECERFLGPKGFGGVQVSPPNEHALVDTPSFRPWWQRYRPVSLKLNSRSGNETEFRDMVRRCNTVGVRIYVDAVFNHMANSIGYGSAGSVFSGNSMSYPSVPFGKADFNDAKCNSTDGVTITSYQNAYWVRNCRLSNLPDLDGSNEYVRTKIVEYFNNLINIGVAGFRIANAKHMWPEDVDIIVKRLNNLRTDIFGVGKRPFIYLEVIDLGTEPIKSTDYTHIGRVTELKYSHRLSQVVKKQNGQLMKHLFNFGVGWGFIPVNDSIALIDTCDNQRGEGGGGDILTFFEPKRYKIANAFMLACPYGLVHILSSFNFPKGSNDQGPPSNSRGETIDVFINADGSCNSEWNCEHRWPQITPMVKFRNIAYGEPVQNWWDNGFHQIAFSRGNKAFIAINNENGDMNSKIKTGLPEGTYCDIITGGKEGIACKGISVVVDSQGFSQIIIPLSNENPIIAIHEESKL